MSRPGRGVVSTADEEQRRMRLDKWFEELAVKMSRLHAEHRAARDRQNDGEQAAGSQSEPSRNVASSSDRRPPVDTAAHTPDDMLLSKGAPLDEQGTGTHQTTRKSGTGKKVSSKAAAKQKQVKPKTKPKVALKKAQKKQSGAQKKQSGALPASSLQIVKYKGPTAPVLIPQTRMLALTETPHIWTHTSKNHPSRFLSLSKGRRNSSNPAPPGKKVTVRVLNKQSGYNGVSWSRHKNAWKVFYVENGKRIVRIFNPRRFLIPGVTEDEAEKEALEAAIALRKSKEGSIENRCTVPLTRGVLWYKRDSCWRASIRVQGKYVAGGNFYPKDFTPEEIEKARRRAVAARLNLERKHFKISVVAHA